MSTKLIEPAVDIAGATHTLRPGRANSDRSSTVGLEISDLLVPWIVGVTTLVARLATAAKGPTDWDSAQYAAAIARFDVTHGRPHPPGYWLYVVAGRIVHTLGPGVIHSLVLVSAVASGVAAGLVVIAGRDLGGRWVGLAAGIVVAASPFAWFSGSIVASYSFDLLIAPVLIILAWRARPHSWHGAAALASLGLAAGFRQSSLQIFGLLALVAVLGSVRRLREGLIAAAIGLAAVAAWVVPMSMAQPGGFATWVRASRIETLGAIRSTSILDHAAAGVTNVGTFAAYATVALAPLAVLTLFSAVALAVRSLVRGHHARRSGRAAAVAVTVTGRPAGASQPAGASKPIGAEQFDEWFRSERLEATEGLGATSHPVATRPSWVRPWFQSRWVILTAATAPAIAVVMLVQFAKGGYLLAVLPGAAIALLLAPGELVSPRQPADPAPYRAPRAEPRRHLSIPWLILVSLAVLAVASIGADRFLQGNGVLPAAATTSTRLHWLWLTQARYQAPYADTRSAVRTADQIDIGLAHLSPLVHADRDVVVMDVIDGGASFYRNAGWELLHDRVALITPGAVIYNQLHGSLYYASGSTLPVGVGGVVYLIAPPSLPGIAQLTKDGAASAIPLTAPIGDYRLWMIRPGASILDVHIVVEPGLRPLGTGITS